MWKFLSIPFRGFVNMRRVERFALEVLVNNYMSAFGNRQPTSVPESWTEAKYGFSVRDDFFAGVKSLYQRWSEETNHLACDLPPSPLGVEYIISMYSVTFCYAVQNKIIFLQKPIPQKDLALIASSVDSKLREFCSYFLKPACEEQYH
jgi:hypothetical protein